MWAHIFGREAVRSLLRHKLVGRETLGEAAIRVAHVEHHVPHILAAFDVPECGLHVSDGATLHQLEQPPVLAEPCPKRCYRDDCPRAGYHGHPY